MKYSKKGSSRSISPSAFEQRVDIGRMHLEVLTELAERGRQLADPRSPRAS
jgi:hypothetical protein